jgi:hypothetical protein
MTRKLTILAIAVLVVVLGIAVYICLISDAYAVPCQPYPQCLGIPPEPPLAPGVYDLNPPIYLDCEGGGSGGYYDEDPIHLDQLNLPRGFACEIRFYFQGCMSFDPGCPMCVRFLKGNEIVTSACPDAGWTCRVAVWTEFFNAKSGVNRVILYPCYDHGDCQLWAGGGYVLITKFELFYDPLAPQQNMLKASASEFRFELGANHPNPFNPETEISYDLANDCWVKLSIYNISGQKVKTLVDRFEAAGHKTVKWDGRNEQGEQVASGVLFYRLEAGEFTATKKMVLLR